MTKHHFCTLFDSNYLFKGVAMLQSLFQNCPDAHVHVLCMDEQMQDILTRLGIGPITCIPLSDIEDEALLAVKGDRSVAEYCWTLSPCLPWYILEHNPDIDFITYLDADLLFYSSLEPLFKEIGTASIAIIEHRFTTRLEHLVINGRFCVEWVSFRRDEEGMACLSRWRDQCIEWCYYRLDENRLGDQKYLDEWPERYKNLCILQHEGAGIAPWNYAKYEFGQLGDGRISVNGSPLIFYHFHQFQLLQNGGFDRLTPFYTSEKQEPLPIYERYESELRRVIEEVRKIVPGFSQGLRPVTRVKAKRAIQRFLPRVIKDVLRRFIHN